MLGSPSQKPHMKRSQAKSEVAKSKAQRVMLAKRKLPHCSQSACTAMVKLAKNTDLSEFPNTRMSYRRARSATLGDTTSGPMIKTVPLTSTPPHANRDMHVVNPWAYLHTAFNNGGGFFDLIKSRLAAGAVFA